ncbi:TPA: hypothetical protein EYP44_03975 [Candidatus Bathyarchaeota archaeon]|nr:hypothetical protein [Candidatus Bathyarchaeota archaeon]
MLRTRELSGAVVFGALSAGMVFLPMIHLPWGMAVMDPKSFPWIICFFLFGPRAGLLSAVIGALAIASTGDWIGAVMKFIATAPMFLGPAAMLLIASRLTARIRNSSSILANPMVWFPLAGLGVLIRILVCYFVNLYWAVPLFMGKPMEDVLRIFGGYAGFFAMVAAWNAWQSLWDALIPWLAIYPTKLYRYGTW